MIGPALGVFMRNGMSVRFLYQIQGMPDNLNPTKGNEAQHWYWSEGGSTSREAVNCSGRDLNPHAFRHTPLKRTCLPFHHPSERKWIVNGKWWSEARKRFVVQVFTLAHARNRK